MNNRIIGGTPKRAGFILLLGLFLVLLGATSLLHADEPFARSKDYDLEHSRIALRFDLEQKNGHRRRHPHAHHSPRHRTHHLRFRRPPDPERHRE